MIARALLALAFAAACDAPALAQKAPPAADRRRSPSSTPSSFERGARHDPPHSQRRALPYAKDGAVFGNREGQLPPQKRGYYKEYTVKTPGVRTRGTRRIIKGGGGELYYTDDHYKPFSAGSANRGVRWRSQRSRNCSMRTAAACGSWPTTPT
jgi:hypothetical protein